MLTAGWTHAVCAPTVFSALASITSSSLSSHVTVGARETQFIFRFPRATSFLFFLPLEQIQVCLPLEQNLSPFICFWVPQAGLLLFGARAGERAAFGSAAYYGMQNAGLAFSNSMTNMSWEIEPGNHPR